MLWSSPSLLEYYDVFHVSSNDPNVQIFDRRWNKQIFSPQCAFFDGVKAHPTLRIVLHIPRLDKCKVVRLNNIQDFKNVIFMHHPLLAYTTFKSLCLTPSVRFKNHPNYKRRCGRGRADPHSYKTGTFFQQKNLIRHDLMNASNKNFNFHCKLVKRRLTKFLLETFLRNDSLARA